MAAVSRSRPFQGGGNPFRMACFEQCPSVIRPAILVEVGGKEPAGLILQQRIDPCDEVTEVGIASTQMLFDDVTREWDERLMRAAA